MAGVLTLNDAARHARENRDLDLSREDPAIIDALLSALLARLPTLDRELASTLVTALWRWGASANAYGVSRRGFLCAVLDDERQTQTARYDAAVLLLADGDEESLRSLAARARVGAVPPDVGARALLAMDPAEGYDELAACYRNDGAWRRRIAMLLNERADDRWVDEALVIAAVDPENAARTLGALGSARAREELLQWIDAGDAIDGRVSAAAAALEKLGDPRGAEAVARLRTRV